MRRLVALRYATLTAVNALILFHIYVYYIRGNTSVGCVDFYGLTTAAAQGRITAGTILIAGLIALTLTLGRVFCGWGCHFALFQDITSAVADRLGFRLPFRQSRVQWVIPPLLLLTTIGLPILKYWREHGTPTGLTTDLSYPEVWHLLPGWKGVLLLLVVDAVVLTLIFGKRAFCRYACPYGFLLKFFHAVSPTRIVARGQCTDCGQCVTACPTGVPIKFEIAQFGLIHDLNCMNCGDCIPSCPSGVLSLRPTPSAYAVTFAGTVRGARKAKWTEIALLASAISGWVLYRGTDFGDFLAVGLGLVTGAAIVASISPDKMFRRRWLSGDAYPRNRVKLCSAIMAGYLVLGMVGQGIALSTLSMGVRLMGKGDHERALRVFEMGSVASPFFKPFTFYLDDFADRAPTVGERMFGQANAYLESGDWHEAEVLYRIVVLLDERRVQAHGNLGTALYMQSRFWEATRCYIRVLDADPHDLIALYHLVMTRTRLGDLDGAARLLQQIFSIDTDGSMYGLLASNPELLPLRESDAGRRLFEMYQRTHGASQAGGKI